MGKTHPVGLCGGAALVPELTEPFPMCEPSELRSHLVSASARRGSCAPGLREGCFQGAPLML